MRKSWNGKTFLSYIGLNYRISSHTLFSFVWGIVEKKSKWKNGRKKLQCIWDLFQHWKFCDWFILNYNNGSCEHIWGETRSHMRICRGCKSKARIAPNQGNSYASTICARWMLDQSRQNLSKRINLRFPPKIIFLPTYVYNRHINASSSLKQSNINGDSIIVRTRMTTINHWWLMAGVLSLVDKCYKWSLFRY